MNFRTRTDHQAVTGGAPVCTTTQKPPPQVPAPPTPTTAFAYLHLIAFTPTHPFQTIHHVFAVQQDVSAALGCTVQLTQVHVHLVQHVSTLTGRPSIPLLVRAEKHLVIHMPECIVTLL